MNSLQRCAGAGGHAFRLEDTGFEHRLPVEINTHACATLRHNRPHRPHWQVQEGDLSAFDARTFKGMDLVADGGSCPPFSKAGKGVHAFHQRQAAQLKGSSLPRTATEPQSFNAFHFHFF